MPRTSAAPRPPRPTGTSRLPLATTGSLCVQRGPPPLASVPRLAVTGTGARHARADELGLRRSHLVRRSGTAPRTPGRSPPNPPAHRPVHDRLPTANSPESTHSIWVRSPLGHTIYPQAAAFGRLPISCCFRAHWSVARTCRRPDPASGRSREFCLLVQPALSPCCRRSVVDGGGHGAVGLPGTARTGNVQTVRPPMTGMHTVTSY